MLWAAAQLSGHSLPLSLPWADINWAVVLGCVHCLRTADLVLTWNVPNVGKTSVTFNFLVTTSAPVFVPMDPKFLVRESTQPLQGGPALLNSWHGEWDFGRQSLRCCWKHPPMSCLIQFSILECLHERDRRKGLPMNIISTNQHGINAAKGMVCLYTHSLMHVNVLNSVRTCKARSYMNLAVTHFLKHYFFFCLQIPLMPNGPRTSKTYHNLNLSFMLLLPSASSWGKASFSLGLEALSSGF